MKSKKLPSFAFATFALLSGPTLAHEATSPATEETAKADAPSVGYAVAGAWSFFAASVGVALLPALFRRRRDGIDPSP
jgi:hypothetical protein